MKKIFLLLICFILPSCKINEISYNYPDNPDYARKARAGKTSDSDLIIYEQKKKSDSN